MEYTFWHAGILIGTSALDHPSRNPGQRGGVFQPTPHGIAIFPRLTGILGAGLALKRQLDARGLSPDDLSPDETATLLETSPAGRKILDLGRALSDVEVHGPDGRRLEFSSIAFTDLAELRTITREIDPGGADGMADLPPEAPRYIVSATFRANAAASERDAARRMPPRHLRSFDH